MVTKSKFYWHGGYPCHFPYCTSSNWYQPMTIVCGVETKNGFVIGADSGVFSSNGRSINREPKLFTLSRVTDGEDEVDIKVTFGVAGSIRLSQLIKYYFKLPSRKPRDCSDMAWLATDFITALRGCLTEHGYIQKTDNVESFGDYSIVLVGFNKRLYVVEYDYHISSYSNGIVSIGAGDDFALGAIHAMIGLGKDPFDIILAGLNASLEYCNYVARPFVIQEWENSELKIETKV